MTIGVAMPPKAFWMTIGVNCFVKKGLRNNVVKTLGMTTEVAMLPKAFWMTIGVNCFVKKGLRNNVVKKGGFYSQSHRRQSLQQR